MDVIILVLGYLYVSWWTNRIHEEVVMNENTSNVSSFEALAWFSTLTVFGCYAVYALIANIVGLFL